MSRLPIPPENKILEQIFNDCIKTFRAPKRDRLAQCLPLLMIDAENYKKLVPEHIDQFQASTLPEGVSEADLVSVYKEKFAPQGQPGRDYYDAIMAQARNDICPICGVRNVSTLDHYLPKSKVPTLAVTPINLVPACRDCNMEKSDDMELKPDKTPAHMYLDEIDDRPWLYTEIAENLEVRYVVRCSEEWRPDVRSRVEKHLDHYHLHKLYSTHACSEIKHLERSWRRLLERGGEEALRDYITDTRESSEEAELNSWHAALYRGLEENFHVLVAYLKKKSMGVAPSAV